MENIYRLYRFIRRPFWRFRKFWRRVYYSVTDALMILGGSVLLSVVWYFLFLK